MKIQAVGRSRRRDYKTEKIRNFIARTGYSAFEGFVRSMTYVSLVALIFFGSGLGDDVFWDECLVGVAISGAILTLTGIIRLEVFGEE